MHPVSLLAITMLLLTGRIVTAESANTHIKPNCEWHRSSESRTWKIMEEGPMKLTKIVQPPARLLQ